MPEALFICFHHYKNTGETFYQGENPVEVYNYKSVQRDSMRCLLLFLPISIKAYLIEIIKTPADKVVPAAVSQFVIKQMKLIKFAMMMLFPSDFHIKQVLVSLDTIEKYGKDILEHCECFEDFKLIYKTISQEFETKMLPLNESKLSKKQGEIFKFHENYQNYLNPAYLEYYKELQERSINDLHDYQIPFNMQERFFKAFEAFKRKFMPINI